MARATKEWRGKNDDSVPPPRVRRRVYDRANGICHICTLPIKPGESWHADHVKAIIAGGENRERNLAPAHGHCNLAKAKGETAEKSKVAQTRQKHLGIKTVKRPLKSRNDFGLSEHKAKRQAADKLPIPAQRRSLYAPTGEIIKEGRNR